MTDPDMIALIVEGEDTVGGETFSVVRPVYAGQPASVAIRCPLGCENSVETRQEAALIVLKWIGGMSSDERVRFYLAMRRE